MLAVIRKIMLSNDSKLFEASVEDLEQKLSEEREQDEC